MVSKDIYRGLNPSEIDYFYQFNPDNYFISTALAWAIIAHRDQKRRSGEPYITHPIEVTRILSEEWGIKQWKIKAAALLHDTVEDSETSFNNIRSRWGRKVASLVSDVTKFGSNLETLKKVSTRSYVDIATGFIKIADRLANMRTLQYLSPEKQIEIAEETNLVYTGLAESLGMWTVKEELGDLSFQYLHPDMFQKISAEMDSDPRMEDKFQKKYTDQIKNSLKAAGLDCEVSVRLKGKYSTYLKQEKKIFTGECGRNDLAGISDLISIGISVKSRGECYQALGLIQEIFQGSLKDKHVKDQIATPADNGFRALQTTISTPSGPVEIAIMTDEMKAFNDLGAVSVYGLEHKKQAPLKPIFLPSGRVLFMPPNSTGVDLMIVTNPALSLKNPVLIVDGKITPITQVLSVGATAEIITDDLPSTGIQKDWFSHSSASNQRELMSVMLNIPEEALREQGRQILQDLLIPRGLIYLPDVGKKLLAKFIQNLDRRENQVKQLDQLYHLLGGNFLDAGRVTSVLDDLGITKENLGLTTIFVSGSKDQPGILEKINKQVYKYGGNIKVVFTEVDDNFQIRLVVKGLSAAHENAIRHTLSQNPLFDQVIVV